MALTQNQMIMMLAYRLDSESAILDDRHPMASRLEEFERDFLVDDVVFRKKDLVRVFAIEIRRIAIRSLQRWRERIRDILCICRDFDAIGDTIVERVFEVQLLDVCTD